MNLPSPSSIAFSLLLLLPTAAATSAVAPATPVEEPSDDFRARFLKAMQQNAKPDMVKLVKAEPDDARRWIVKAGEQLLEETTDERTAFLNELAEAWKSAFKSEFGTRTATYYTTLDPAKKKDRAELRGRFRAAHEEFEGNLETKDGLVFANIVDEIEILAAGFEEVGDDYHAAQAWSDYARCYDEELRGGAADLHRAYNGWKSAVEAFERVDLEDAAYDRAVKRKASLLAKGHDKKQTPPAPGDGPSAPAAPPSSGPATQDGTAIAVPLAFEMLPTHDAYLRPSYHADDIYEIWIQLQLKAKGSTANFIYFDAVPPLVRVGASDVRFDTNRDGQGDEKVPLTGNITPVMVQVGEAAAARSWAFFAVTALQKDSYQGIEMNLAPDDDQMTIYTIGAASVVGTVDGTPVRVIDDWMDGIYGAKPQSWGHLGLSAEAVQPEMDSIVIGTSKRARPFSELQEINGKWYRLAVDPEGKQLSATPVTVETGTLKLDYKGPAPTWLVVRGMPDTSNTFFDLVEGGTKGVNVPAGSYQLYYGEVRKGKKRQTQKTLILPPKMPETYTVTAGGTTVVQLGGPYSFDFRFTFEEEKVKVDGKSVVVVGAKGERYERPWNCVPKPEVSWRKKGTKKASKGERMHLVLDNNQVVELGWRAAWSPLDLELDAKGGVDAVEVQLVDKKHELFGKVESDWKE